MGNILSITLKDVAALHGKGTGHGGYDGCKEFYDIKYFVPIYFYHKIVFFKNELFFFSGAEKRTKRDTHPTKASPQGEDAIDYEGDPLHQSFGKIHSAVALRVNLD